VRVIAATNRDVAAMVRQGLFREDLFFRLNTIRLEIPPLRARRSDVDALAAHFVARFNERFGFRKRLGDAALAQLRAYDWPGNVREFLHVIESAMVMCEGLEVEPDHLPAALRAPGPRTSTDSQPPGGLLPTLAELERAHIRRVIEATNGHRHQAAVTLGISERNLYRKLREYDLER
jgi:DNA-binding NtrC family response regulator